MLAVLGRGSQDCYHRNLRGPCSGLPKKKETQFKNQWAVGTRSSAEKGAWPLCLDHLPCALAATALEAAMHPLICAQALNTGSCRVQIIASLPRDHTVTSLVAHTLRAGQASGRSREKRRALSLRSLETKTSNPTIHHSLTNKQLSCLKSTQTRADANRVTTAESPVLSGARRACVSRWEQRAQGPIGAHAFDFRHHAT